MTTFFVHHQKNPDWMETFDKFKDIYKTDDMPCVAHVETEELGDVFRLTNHIDHDWTENPEVNLMTDEPVRSTSCGDIIGELVPGQGINEIRWLMVAGIGHKELMAIPGVGWKIKACMTEGEPEI